MAGEEDVAEVTRAERRIYSQFFEHLGISDNHQTAFLCTLLRNVYESTSKLDSHLAPHGASIHSAVSRMLVSDNPREAPCHRWIRVFDRMGFFADDDRHAERVVNCGLAYAYRYMEADALVEANAVLLGTVVQKAQVLSGDQGDEEEDILDGRVVVQSKSGAAAASTASKVPSTSAADAGRNGSDHELALPPGDSVASLLPTPAASRRSRGGDYSDDEPILPDGGRVVGTGRPGCSPLPSSSAAQHGSLEHAPARYQGRLDAACAEDVEEASILDGGMVVSTGGGRLPAAPGGASSDDADEIDNEEDRGGPSPSHLVHERQPKIFPNDHATDTVGGILRSVGSQPDGADILRKLLDDSLLCLAHTAPGAESTTARTDPHGSSSEWTAVNKINDKWRPTWESPQDLGAVLPPEGTFAHRANRKRRAASSRWNVLVDMSAINRVLEEIDVGSSRYFRKAKLLETETVVRVHYSKPLRLPVGVACMLLLVVKVERFGPISERLAAAGRSSVQKHGRLSTAGRHEFFTSGLSSATPASPAPAAPSSGSAQGADAPAAPQAAADISQQIAAMSTRLAAEGAKQATQRREERAKIRRAKLLTRAAPRHPAAPSSKAPTSQASGSGSTLVNVVAAPSQGTSAGKPPRGVKRVRAPRAAGPAPRRGAVTHPPTATQRDKRGPTPDGVHGAFPETTGAAVQDGGGCGAGATMVDLAATAAGAGGGFEGLAPVAAAAPGGAAAQAGGGGGAGVAPVLPVAPASGFLYGRGELVPVAAAAPGGAAAQAGGGGGAGVAPVLPVAQASGFLGGSVELVPLAAAAPGGAAARAGGGGGAGVEPVLPVAPAYGFGGAEEGLTPAGHPSYSYVSSLPSVPSTGSTLDDAVHHFNGPASNVDSPTTLATLYGSG